MSNWHSLKTDWGQKETHMASTKCKRCCGIESKETRTSALHKKGLNSTIALHDQQKGFYLMTLHKQYHLRQTSLMDWKARVVIETCAGRRQSYTITWLSIVG